MRYIILLILAILPSVMICNYVYKRDKQKEPKKLLIKLFLGGLASAVLAVVVSLLLDNILPIMSVNESSLDIIQLVFYTFICIALIEELSKWIFVYIISYNHKEFDQFYDMIIYSTFVALGFATIENILYVIPSGFQTAIIRLLLSVPGHACYGIYMGYYLGLAKIATYNNRTDLKNKYMRMSIIVPTILHGIFDCCLLSGQLLYLIVFFVFVIVMYSMALKKVKLVSKIERKMKYKNKYCPSCGTIINSNFCSGCGRANE